jgi:hypothetical protein
LSGTEQMFSGGFLVCPFHQRSRSDV